jgi:hypothetical protein
VDGTAFDLTGSSVKFKMRLETSATLKVDTAAVVVSAAAGTVRYDWAAIDVDTAGDYIGWWEVTLSGGKLQDTPQFSIHMVDLAAVALDTRALVGLRETKDWLEERDIDTSNDLKITTAINGVSEEFQRVSGREIKPNGTNPETRIFDLGWNGSSVLVGDLQTATTASSTISVSDLTTGTLLHTFVAADYVSMPRNRKPWQPVTSIYFQRGIWGYNRAGNYLSVTGYWGFPTVPENVKHAVKDGVAFWLDTDVEHFRQDLGAGTGEAGQTVFLGSGPPTVYSLPPSSYKTALDYRRKLIA